MKKENILVGNESSVLGRSGYNGYTTAAWLRRRPTGKCDCFLFSRSRRPVDQWSDRVNMIRLTAICARTPFETIDSAEVQSSRRNPYLVRFGSIPFPLKDRPEKKKSRHDFTKNGRLPLELLLSVTKFTHYSFSFTARHIYNTRTIQYTVFTLKAALCLSLF